MWAVVLVQAGIVAVALAKGVFVHLLYLEDRPNKRSSHMPREPTPARLSERTMEGVFSLADYRPIAPPTIRVLGVPAVTVLEVLTARPWALCMECVITLTGLGADDAIDHLKRPPNCASPTKVAATVAAGSGRCSPTRAARALQVAPRHRHACYDALF